jgi:hypothetical protein
MNGYLEGYRGTASPAVGHDQAVRCLRDRFPLIGQILAGISGASVADSVPPATIMVFLEGGRVKFAVAPKWGNAVAFGTCPEDCQDVGEGIERVLKAGGLEWRPRRGRTSTGQPAGVVAIIQGQAEAKPKKANSK